MLFTGWNVVCEKIERYIGCFVLRVVDILKVIRPWHGVAYFVCLWYSRPFNFLPDFDELIKALELKCYKDWIPLVIGNYNGINQRKKVGKIFKDIFYGNLHKVPANRNQKFNLLVVYFHPPSGTWLLTCVFMCCYVHQCVCLVVFLGCTLYPHTEEN